MADITMCRAAVCPRSRSCKRHEDSGTTPNEWMQAFWTPLPSDIGEHGCEMRWPVPAPTKES